MKTLLRLLGAVWFSAVLLVGVGGCTWLSDSPFAPSSTAVVPTATQARPSFTPTLTPTLTPSASSQGLQIELWAPEFLSPYAGESSAEIFSSQLAAFEASYTFRDFRVNVTVKKGTGAGGLYHLLTTAADVAPGVLPDLLVLNQHDVLAASAEGLLHRLDADLLRNIDYYTTTLNSVRNSAGIWAFPYLAMADQMAYRPGITDTAPLTWSAVLSSGYTLLLPAASPDGLAGDTLLQIYLGSGGRVMDQSGQPSLDRAVLERVYGFLLDLQRAGLLDAEQALSLTNTAACWNAYQEGTGALSPVPLGQFWSQPSEGALPAWAPTETGEPITVINTWGVAVVTQDPARREAALLLARWMIAPNHMAQMAQAVSLAPTRRSAIQEWGLSADDRVFMDTLLSRAVSALPPSVDTPVRRGLQAGLVALLQQDVDSPEAAASTALLALRR